MKQSLEQRLQALEQRRQSKIVPNGMAHFYSMARAEQERALAPFYGRAPHGKP